MTTEADHIRGDAASRVGAPATARSLCTRQVVTALAGESVAAAAARMAEHHVGDLVVVDARREMARPIGILTDRDIVLRVVAPRRNPDGLTVGDVMTCPPIVANEVDDVDVVVGTMLRHGIRRMPVVARDGGLVGIVSHPDLLGWLGDAMDALIGGFAAAARRERGQGEPLRWRACPPSAAGGERGLVPGR